MQELDRALCRNMAKYVWKGREYAWMSEFTIIDKL